MPERLGCTTRKFITMYQDLLGAYLKIGKRSGAKSIIFVSKIAYGCLNLDCKGLLYPR